MFPNSTIFYIRYSSPANIKAFSYAGWPLSIYERLFYLYHITFGKFLAPFVNAIIQLFNGWVSIYAEAMRPCSPTNDFLNYCFRYKTNSFKDRSCAATSQNKTVNLRNNLLIENGLTGRFSPPNKFWEFSSVVVIATGSIGPSLLDAVHKIVAGCANKKMTWVNTGCIVAFMANKHLFWDRLFIYRERNSVSHNSFISIRKYSVSCWISCSIPHPAVFFGRFLKETFKSSARYIIYHGDYHRRLAIQSKRII